jgi:hypothetical protein
MKLVVGDQGKGHDGVGSSTMVRPREKGLVFLKNGGCIPGLSIKTMQTTFFI